MLSKAELGTMCHYARYATRFKLMDWDWDQKRHVLHISKDKWRTCCYYGYLALVVYHTAYAAYRAHEQSNNERGRRSEVAVVHATAFVAYLNTLVCQIAFAWKRHELVQIFTALVHVSRASDPGGTPPPKYRGILLQYGQKGMAVLSIFFVTPCFVAIEFLDAWATRGWFLLTLLHPAIFLLNLASCYAIAGYLLTTAFLYFDIINDGLKGKDVHFVIRF